MMKKHMKTHIVLALLISIIFMPSLKAVDILAILEGYGRDSIATFSTQHAQAEAAKVFNLLLEPNGEITIEKAEEYLNSTSSSTMKAYLAVILADYSFVNYNFDTGLRYLKKAVDEHDPIRNDSYYRLVLSRAQKAILESPGKTTEHKTSVLSDYKPRAFLKEPVVKQVEVKPEVKETQTEGAIPRPNVTPEVVEKEEPIEELVIIDNSEPEPVIEEPKESIPVKVKEDNFRIQIGAFSVYDNAMRKKSFFEDKDYSVNIVRREISSGTLYIVQLGAYEDYDEAKYALTKFKSRFPSEEGIVVRVNK
jgi:hypothetical protein